MATRYDVAIIGTGAGGGTLAYALASTGKQILVLERGDYVPASRTPGTRTRVWQVDHWQCEPGVDPTDAPARAPYPHPPVSHEPRIQQLADDWARLGRRPFHVPLGVMLDEANPRKSACIRCATCDGHPCLVNAKSDAQVVCVDRALEHAKVTLLTNAHVTRLEQSATGL